MVERFADKKNRILEAILNESKSANESHEIRLLSGDVAVAPGDFSAIMNSLDADGFIKLEGIWELQNEERNWLVVTSPNDALAAFTLLRQGEITKQLSQLKAEFPKRSKPIFRDQTNELIAREIGGISTGPRLVHLFETWGVDPALIVYPNTKWRMVHDVLNYLCVSDKKEDTLALQNILREFSHPLTHGGDAQKAKDFEKQLDTWVEYDGFRIINGDLVGIEGGGFHQTSAGEKQKHYPVSNHQPAPISENILKKLQSATSWEQIRFEFGEDQDRTEMYIYDDRVGDFHFDDLGFGKGSSKESKPVKSWNMLQVMGMSRGRHPCKTNQDKSTKKALQIRIQALFPHMIGIPIGHDDTVKEYYAKFKVINKTDRRNSHLDHRANNRPNEFLRNFSS
ncbi:hypothetical protein HYV73_00920 [Candidatus Uhrbacteria bacterium]|nr:hypothetical protein [Candidatus Uhrbacteria bacterium]